MDFTEARMQAVLMRRALRVFQHELAITNTTVYGWESDLITVTRAGIVHEHEIKVSRADWLAELRAVRKRGAKRGRAVALQHADIKRHQYGNGKPNLFWVVTPPGVVDVENELPHYAGLITVHRTDDLRAVEAVKYAPRLHRDKISQHTKNWIARGLALRLSDELWRQHART